MADQDGHRRDLRAEVLQNDKPVVVDFWAAWCGPCKLVAPRWRSSPQKYEGAIDIVKVDVDANPGLSRAFNIMSIPTIAFFAPGKQPMGVVGFRPAEQLEAQFSLAQFSAAATPASAERQPGLTALAPRTNEARPATVGFLISTGLVSQSSVLRRQLAPEVEPCRRAVERVAVPLTLARGVTHCEPRSRAPDAPGPECGRGDLGPEAEAPRLGRQRRRTPRRARRTR